MYVHYCVFLIIYNLLGFWDYYHLTVDTPIYFARLIIAEFIMKFPDIFMNIAIVTPGFFYPFISYIEFEESFNILVEVWKLFASCYFFDLTCSYSSLFISGWLSASINSKYWVSKILVPQLCIMISMRFHYYTLLVWIILCTWIIFKKIEYTNFTFINPTPNPESIIPKKHFIYRKCSFKRTI